MVKLTRMANRQELTFEDFLDLVRERIGHYCRDEYWNWKYNNLPDKSRSAIEKELPYLGVNAIGTHNSSTYI